MLSLRFCPANFRKFVFFRNHSTITSLLVKDVIRIKPLNRLLALRGWVQAVRKHKDLVFVDLVDNSSLDRLQVIIPAEKSKPPPSYGSSVSVQGVLLKSEHEGQEVELLCDSWHTIGRCAEDYPFLPRHTHSADYVRQLPHLRPKTRIVQSLMRVRCKAKSAVNNFFLDRDFIDTDTPIITQNDCEGGGEVFYLETRDECVSQRDAEILNQQDTEEHSKKQSSLSVDKTGARVNEKKNEFFKYPACLTVSAQFHLEALTCVCPGVYTFGRAFRAEKNHTSNHQSEFSMIEAEMAFVESLTDMTTLIESLLKDLIVHVMDTCPKEMDVICSKYTQNHRKYLSKILSTPFLSMSYTEALEILEKHRKSLKVSIKWGEDLGSEHKKFLIKHCNNIPVFVTEFPASLLPFYMKTTNDGKGLNFDLFAPFGNEICTGSLREENYEILKDRLENSGLIGSHKSPEKHLENLGMCGSHKYPGEENCKEDSTKTENFEDSETCTDPLLWYLELRKYGSIPHAGFGIGFDRALQTILGIPNIRDVVLFPRWYDHCKC